MFKLDAIWAKCSSLAGALWRSIFGPSAPEVVPEQEERQPVSRAKARPKPTYTERVVVARPPQPAEVPADTIVVVAPRETLKWVMFRCPCPCREVITLSLQKVHNPHWKLLAGPDGHASLRPSVWRTQGCRSHFWVDDGRVYWS